MRSRGFTLLEILVALGVLGVVLGLSLPAISARLDRGSFDANAERLVGALRLARDEARDAGRPVSVRARTPGLGPTFVEWSFATSPAARESSPQGVPAEPAWTKLVEIPRSYFVSDQDPAAIDPNGSASASPDPLLSDAALESGLDEGGTRTLPVCVFTPGAEAIVSGPVWLVDADRARLPEVNRWVKLTLSPWTGRMSVERGFPSKAGDVLAPEPEEPGARGAPVATEPGVSP